MFSFDFSGTGFGAATAAHSTRNCAPTAFTGAQLLLAPPAAARAKGGTGTQGCTSPTPRHAGWRTVFEGQGSGAGQGWPRALRRFAHMRAGMPWVPAGRPGYSAPIAVELCLPVRALAPCPATAARGDLLAGLGYGRAGPAAAAAIGGAAIAGSVQVSPDGRAALCARSQAAGDKPAVAVTACG